MDKSDLVDKIVSFGAFIPEKFQDLHSEGLSELGKELFREYSRDVSIQYWCIIFSS